MVYNIYTKDIGSETNSTYIIHKRDGFESQPRLFSCFMKKWFYKENEMYISNVTKYEQTD